MKGKAPGEAGGRGAPPASAGTDATIDRHPCGRAVQPPSAAQAAVTAEAEAARSGDARAPPPALMRDSGVLKGQSPEPANAPRTQGGGRSHGKDE